MSSLKRSISTSSASGAPKRTRTQPEASTSASTEPEDVDEDELMEQDLPGSAPKIARRNKLREVQAYASDSSEDEFFSSARKSRAESSGKKDEDGGAEDDDDDDMFGGDSPKESGGKGAGRGEEAGGGGESSDEDDIDGVSKRSRRVRFLDISQIEGQESADQDVVDAEEANAEFENFVKSRASATGLEGKGKEPARDMMDLDNEDDNNENQEDEELDPEIGLTGSRKHAPKVEAFNMRADLEDGAFDEDGNYIRTTSATDEKAEEAHDAWMTGLSSNEIKAAKAADDARRERERQNELQSLREQEEVTAAEHMAKLMEQLEVAETPFEALARLGPGKKVKKNRNRRKAAAASSGETAEEAEKERARKTSVEAISDAADKLLNRGMKDVYEMSREQLARAYARDTGEQWRPPRRNSESD
ncbi:hypothetical protein BZA70DRAFT_285266 [Myxozyma melibiosi]|uniref:DNA replication checkpoint mediator MRC1 domain-containing protein n=1 Tax=Myxozyma melibiosi TaxID=54550 RepID=A0ABR1F050_9ASCO